MAYLFFFLLVTLTFMMGPQSENKSLISPSNEFVLIPSTTILYFLSNLLFSFECNLWTIAGFGIWDIIDSLILMLYSFLTVYTFYFSHFGPKLFVATFVYANFSKLYSLWPKQLSLFFNPPINSFLGLPGFLFFSFVKDTFSDLEHFSCSFYFEAEILKLFSFIFSLFYFSDF